MTVRICLRCSELRFPLKSRKVGLKEIPPALEPLTVTVHVGPDEEIVGMATVEVEDIEGIVSSGYQAPLYLELSYL